MINIFNNYDIESYLEVAKENLIDNDEEITENNLYQEAAYIEQDDFETAMDELKGFFKNSPVLCIGTTERWYGKKTGCSPFDNFEHMWDAMTKDCEYFHIYDENGHLYIQCSHHDGTNLYEIKKLLPKAKNARNIESVIRNYTRLPYFAKLVYGC